MLPKIQIQTHPPHTSGSTMNPNIRLEERFDALVRQHESMFRVSLVPPKKPNLAPKSMRRYSKCQGLGHKTSVCPNKEVFTLAQVQAAMEENEEENEDTSDHKLKETQE